MLSSVNINHYHQLRTGDFSPVEYFVTGQMPSEYADKERLYTKTSHMAHAPVSFGFVDPNKCTSSIGLSLFKRSLENSGKCLTM